MVELRDKLQRLVPPVSYGSNASRGKIEWLRSDLGLTGPVIELQAEIEGAAAVWTGGVRARDGERPAVLAAAPVTLDDGTRYEWVLAYLARPEVSDRT